MTERIASYHDNFELRGIPNQRLLNMYQKWAHGGFGIVLTGNIATHPVNNYSLTREILYSDKSWVRRKCDHLQRKCKRWIEEVVHGNGKNHQSGRIARHRAAHQCRLKTSLYITCRTLKAFLKILFSNEIAC